MSCDNCEYIHRENSKICDCESWKRKKITGQNSKYGRVYTACCEEDCNYVMKIIPFSEKLNKQNIIDEVRFQRELSEKDITPNIYDSWICDNHGVIIMEKLQITVRELLNINPKCKNIVIEECCKLLFHCHSSGIIHNDTHTNNFMLRIYNENYDENNLLECVKFYLIDTGLCEYSRDRNKMDEDYFKFAMNFSMLTVKETNFILNYEEGDTLD